MRQFLILVAGVCLLAGCASPNVNPPSPRANTGYVDFYTSAADDLNWEVARFDERAHKYVVVFSEFKPVPYGVLRLAFPPGKHQLQVTFLNRVIRAPAKFEVTVNSSRVTPVHLILTEYGVTQVIGTGQNVSRNARGASKAASSDADETTVYRISAVVNAPMPYRVKEQMPYAY